MVVKLAIEPSEPRMGYFYALTCSRADDLDDFESLAPELVQSVEAQDEDGEDLLYLRPLSSHRLFWSRCEHREGSEIWFRPTLEYRDIKEVGNMSWYEQGEGMVCKKDLAIRLLTSELLGIVVQRTEFSSPGGHPEPKDWYYVQGGGPSALKRPKMTPETYKCWNCKKEPVCHVCGFAPSVCPHCSADYRIPVRKWDGKDETKLVFYPDEAIVDLKAWDGSDYCGSLITHRMLQFLLKCHAHPFRALPIPVDVKGVTAKELKRLESARTPI